MFQCHGCVFDQSLGIAGFTLLYGCFSMYKRGVGVFFGKNSKT